MSRRLLVLGSFVFATMIFSSGDADAGCGLLKRLRAKRACRGQVAKCQSASRCQPAAACQPIQPVAPCQLAHVCPATVIHIRQISCSPLPVPNSWDRYPVAFEKCDSPTGEDCGEQLSREVQRCSDLHGEGSTLAEVCKAAAYRRYEECLGNRPDNNREQYCEDVIISGPLNCDDPFFGCDPGDYYCYYHRYSCCIYNVNCPYTP